MLTARYFDPSSMSVREATLALNDEASVRDALHREGKQLLSIGPAGFGKHLLAGSRPSLGGRASSGSDVSVFCRELRALVLAGLSVVEAMEALAEGQGDAGFARSIYAQLLDRLKTGKALSSAMSDIGGFPVLLIASVQSSERTSNLPEALDAYLHFDDMVSKLGRRVISAALYPGIVVSLGMLIALFLLWVVMPRFASLYGQMAQDVGGATHVLLTISKWLHSAPWAVPVVVLALAYAAWAIFGSGRWRAIGSRLVAAVPVLHRQQRHFELARVFEALSLLVRGGFGFHEALQLCSQISTSSAGSQRLRMAQALVEQGQSVSRACAAAQMTDAITVRLLRAGERGGDFAAVLHAISLRHATAFETFVDRATRLVEPLLLLAVALLIGGMVVMLYMPIFDIASSVR